MAGAGAFRIIAGLGNPGRQYEQTRHNIGFLLVDELCGATKWKSDFGALVTDLQFGSEKVLAVKPQQYMNRSGGPIQQVLRFYKIEPAELLVVHDEVDLPFGTMRLKRGGGDAGHNGLKSITSALGTPDYLRLRLGIGRRETGGDMAGWVLGRFSSSEQADLTGFLRGATQAVHDLYEHGLQHTQNRWHSVKP